MSEKESVYETILKVMEDVRAVGKTQRVQGAMTRGIDNVLNAVGPAMRHHGLLVLPAVESEEHYTYTTKSGAQMKNVTLKVAYQFSNRSGDVVFTSVVAEASDVSDKATAKAMSIALRTALIQVLALPTEDHTREYEQATAASGKDVLRSIIEAQRVTNEQYIQACQEVLGACPSWDELTDEAASAVADWIAENL